VTTNRNETFISIDVETAGPIPGEYSMLSIGACLVASPFLTFTCELKPINDKFVSEALDVSGLSLERLKETGIEPEVAMSRFREWIIEAAGDNVPVFVGFNAPFDWSFINYYFHRFTGDNPFGFTALDIKALWMGVSGCSWADTRSSRIADAVQPKLHGDHDALHDAQYQAELFRLVLDRREALGRDLIVK
jgi:DNA polymerase III epsilon subunit-like protein